MDDFEAPSFSLGLDEEITPSSHGNAAVLRALNPFKIGIHNETTKSTCKNEANTQTTEGVGDLDSDSEFELLPPSSTPRIIKRLQRKSGHSVLTPMNPPRDVALSQKHSNSLNEPKKARLPQKNSSMTTAGRTLPNFWKGLHCKKSGKGLADASCSKGKAESGLGSVGQPQEFLNRINERKSGASQVSELVAPDSLVNSSTQLDLNHNEGLPEALAGHSRDEKEFLNKVHVDEHFYNNRSYGCLPTKNNRLGPPLETVGSTLHDPFRRAVDANQSTSHNDFSHEYLSGSKEPLLQSPWRSLVHKKETLLSPSPAVHIFGEGKYVDVSQTISKEQSLESPAHAHLRKTNTATSSQKNAAALQSFWKTLNETKSKDCEIDDRAEEDDIENCSTDDDLEYGTQATSKLSLCGNKSERKSFIVSNEADLTPLRSFNQHLLHESFVSPKNSFVFLNSPKSSLVDEKRSLNSTSRYGASLSPANPGTSQSFTCMNAAQISSAPCIDDFRTKKTTPLNNPEAAFMKETVWQCSDDEKENDLFLSQAFDKNKTADYCETPIGAFKANSNVFGGKNNFSVDHVSKNDPRIADLLQLRFPYFLSVSALRQDKFTGPEQVYIDYENQFSGGKAGSCRSEFTTFNQQKAARPTSKWRKSAQKNQKSAMADNGGWIQTGNKNPASRRRSNQNRGHRGSQMPAYTDTNSSAGPGHWVTERTGKRIYITKDGKQLSGSSAYKQHIKDSGKRVKKTKRRRPPSKKQKHY